MKKCNLNEVKIFGIGLSRTGTTSLTTLLQQGFGLNIHHWPDPHRFCMERFSTDPKYLNNGYNNSIIDGITDIQAAIAYKQLYKIYPYAKFILTTREENLWLNSIEPHWLQVAGINGQKLHPNVKNIVTMMWGTTNYSKENVLNVYRNHLREVNDFFSMMNTIGKYKNNFLTLDITSDSKSICKLEKFLNCKSSLQDIPHKNKGSHN